MSYNVVNETRNKGWDYTRKAGRTSYATRAQALGKHSFVVNHYALLNGSVKQNVEKLPFLACQFQGVAGDGT
jgi:hypothetical protein